KVVAARRTELNKELAVLPARIDEVQRGLPEAPDLSKNRLDYGLATARKDRSTAAERLAEAKVCAGDATSERRRLREVEDALTDLDRQATRAADEAVSKARDKVVEAQRALDDSTSRVARLEQQVTDGQADVARLDERLAGLRQEWAAVSARQVD